MTKKYLLLDADTPFVVGIFDTPTEAVAGIQSSYPSGIPSKPTEYFWHEPPVIDERIIRECTIKIPSRLGGHIRHYVWLMELEMNEAKLSPQ